MKTLKSILAVAFLSIILSSCGDSDCKDCSIEGDSMGEYCGENLKEAESTPGVRCK